MKVIVDGRTINNNMTGVGKFSYNTIRMMAKLRKDMKFFVLSNRSIYPFDMDNVEEIVVGNLISEQNTLNKIFSPMWINTFFRKKINILNPDILFYPNFVMPIINNYKSKSVAVIHDVIHKSYPKSHSLIYKKYLNFVINNTVKKADIITTPSKHSKKEISKYYDCKENEIRVTPLGIHKKQNNYIELDFDFPYILLVGTHSPRKNLKVVYKAWKKLKNDFSDLKLVVVGKEGFFSDLVDKKGVIFTGYVSEKKLDALYKNAVVFCFPSLYEGFGMPILEALSHGTPVISANNSSLPEVLGDAGILVDANNIEEWEKGIHKIISDNKFRNKLVNRALQRADIFSWKKTAEKYINIFEELI